MNRILLVSIAVALIACGSSMAYADVIEMSEYEMSSVLGGGAGPCRNCHYAGARFDECLHYADEQNPVPCRDYECIANYHISSTCDLGTPADCSTKMSPDMPGVVQYERADTDCQYGTQNWHTWLTDYYGDECDCSSQPWTAACDKTNGSCDGTLIASYNRGTQILCDN